MEAIDEGHLLATVGLRLLVLRLQEDGAKGRRERQGVDGRDQDGDSHRDTKLAVECTTHTTDERHRDEHGRHHQRDGDDSTRDFVHGVDTGRERTLVAHVELGVNGLDNHDGVIDHDGDSQQEGRQRQQVDGESEDPQEEERTYQGDRHGDHRDQRGAEVLEEDIDDEEHQQQGDEERENHLLDGGVEELRHVLLDGIFQSRWEVLCLALQLGLHVLGNLGCVGSCNLLHHTHHGRVAVVLQLHAVGLLTQFYSGHILEVECLTIGIAREDDVSILLRRLHTALVAERVLVGHVALLADRTRRSLQVLLGQGCRDVGRHEAVVLHLHRVEPDADCVVGRGRALHVTHTVDTLQCRRDVDVVVVVEELRVVASVVRGQRVHDDVGALSLRNRHTRFGHLCREQSLSLLHTVVDVDGSHIGVGSLLEEDRDLCQAAIACRRGDVGHVLHTVDALLQRCHHGVEHRLCVSARIVGHHANGRWRNVRVLLDRQRHQSDRTQEYEEDGDHRREYRSLDKNSKCHCFLLLCVDHDGRRTASSSRWHSLGLLLVALARHGVEEAF